ncbi:MAG: sigma-70 family RNA polymerase sigma factor [Gemmataceae bacterium]|nr:sigma-70 family RNA polymerase sigma factor [Gemmataceae bacterium]
MGIEALNRIVRHLRVSVPPGGARPGDGVTDGELLERYRARRDEAAFEALVRRHGPMVLGVCRRILRNHADADDAFQATFLVLVRKAGAIRRKGMVGNWLYGVAHHTALKARAMHSKRRTKEQEAAAPKSNANEEAWRQAQLVVDDALAGLADKYRVPIVLCDLEGRTIKEAARQLGWPQGTVASRLTRGRAILARRLTRSGLKLSAAGLTLLLVPGTMSAQVPAPLLVTTLKAAGLFAVGNTLAGGIVSASALALTHGVLNAMFMSKLKIAGATLLVAAVLGLGVGASGLAGPLQQLEPAQLEPVAQAPARTPADATAAAPLAVAQAADVKSPAALLRRIEAIEQRLDALIKALEASKKTTAPKKTPALLSDGGLRTPPPGPVGPGAFAPGYSPAAPGRYGPPPTPGAAPAPAARANVEVKIFTLRHLDAAEVAATLTSLLNPDGKTPDGKAPGGRSLRIAAHNSTNSVLVQGTPVNLDTVAVIISQLDDQPAVRRKEKK